MNIESLTTNPHQIGERAIPREEVKNTRKDRTTMGTARTACKTPRTVRRDRQCL